MSTGTSTVDMAAPAGDDKIVWQHEVIAAGLRADPGVWYLAVSAPRALHRRVRQTGYLISHNRITPYQDGRWQVRVSSVGDEIRLYARYLPDGWTE